MLDSLVHTFKSFCGVLAKRLAQRPIFLCLEKRFRRFEHRCERCFWSRWLLYWSPVASWERRPARKASVSRFGTRRQAESRPLSPWLGDVQYGCSEARLWFCSDLIFLCGLSRFWVWSRLGGNRQVGCEKSDLFSQNLIAVCCSPPSFLEQWRCQRFSRRQKYH